jgi:N-acetylglutamate synthase-like GNAT family acetyltransferase
VIKTWHECHHCDTWLRKTPGMPTTLRIRPATPADLQTIGDFIGDLGYSARRAALLGMLAPMLEDHRHSLLLGEEDELGVVAFLSLSSRPVLRLQGWVGTIEEFVVRPGMRDRGIGDRMLQYAKGLAAERGWVRLEALVTRRRESHRRGFLLARGFVQAESIAYRWGLLEGRHQTPPTLYPERRLPERV